MSTKDAPDMKRDGDGYRWRDVPCLDCGATYVCTIKRGEGR